jgi:hypothetical protein
MNDQLQTPSAVKFIEYVKEGITAWTLAAELARREIESNPEWPEEVENISKFITSHAVRRFALIGLKYTPELAIDECSGAKRLRKLPLDFQRKYYTEPLPLLIEKSGQWESLSVSLHNLTAEQSDQVFALDHVRTEAEQRAYIEDKRMRTAAEPVDMPYRIVGDAVICMAGAKLKVRDLEFLLNQMKKRARKAR